MGEAARFAGRVAMITGGSRGIGAGVICLTRSLAKEVALHGITVNCISPATTNTGINRDMPLPSTNPPNPPLSKGGEGGFPAGQTD